MAGSKQSKQKLLAIYDILYRKTDENHTVSAEDIAKRADLEDETVAEIMDILRAEFEDDEE